MATSETQGSTELAARVLELERQNARLSEWAERTDRENRLLKWLGVGAVLVVVALLAVPKVPALAALTGQAAPAMIATEKGIGSQEFSLRNRDGGQMSVLECDKYGAPNLVMLDLKKRYRVGLKVWNDDRADLNFYDTAGQLRGRMGVEADGTAVLGLSTAEGTEQARLAVAPDGTPSFRLTDAAGRVVFQAP